MLQDKGLVIYKDVGRVTSPTAPKFHTWKQEGCTLLENPLRCSFPPESQQNHGVCTVLVHLVY